MWSKGKLPDKRQQWPEDYKAHGKVLARSIHLPVPLTSTSIL